MRFTRFIKSKIYNVPFRTRVWYNLMAMLPKEKRTSNNYINIFDKDGRYIDCPGIGKFVHYFYNGSWYLYKIVGFDNERRDRDWLYDTDYIHPVIEFVKQINIKS